MLSRRYLLIGTLLAVAGLSALAPRWLTNHGGAQEKQAAGSQAAGRAAGPQAVAERLAINFEKLPPGYLNRCVRSGKLLFTSGHTSKTKGRLGKDLTVEQGYAAAREAAVEVLRAVWNTHGTLDNLRVVKVLGCVNSAPEFTDQPKVINGASDLLHEIFGAKADGWHARSALGFAALPGNAAVEIEAIFEIKD